MRRIFSACLVAAVAFAYVYGSWLIWSGYSTDFDQLYWAGVVLQAGRDSYAEIRAFNTDHFVAFGLLYPGPAIVVGALTTWATLPVARALVAALGAGCLTYFLPATRWPILLSAAMRSSVSLVQLTPFLACAALTPWFGWALAMKPNAGLAVWATSENRHKAMIAAGAALAFVAVSFVAVPGWLGGWWAAVTGAHYLRPWVMRPFGFVLLLAALRWRRPEARWLLVAALVPSTANIYEALPLLALMALSFREALILSILSHLADLGGYILRADATYPALVQAHGVTVLWLFYVPVLFLILRRPNEMGVRRVDPVRGAAAHRESRHDLARSARATVDRGATAEVG